MAGFVEKRFRNEASGFVCHRSVGVAKLIDKGTFGLKFRQEAGINFFADQMAFVVETGLHVDPGL
jgi:hypothetical protein